MNLLLYIFIVLANFATITTEAGLCKRAREEYNKITKTGIFPKCDEKGNFAKKQIIAGWEFCVDPVTGKIIPGYAQYLQYFSLMDCECAVRTLKDKNLKCQSNGNELTPCLKRVYSYTHLSGMTPWCDRFGEYNSVQCDDKRCYCVSNVGKKLVNAITGKQYASESLDDTNDMGCGCAVDQHISSRPKTFHCDKLGDYYADCRTERATALINGGEFVPRCDCMGKYHRVQCIGDRCFCADDKLGHMIGHYMFKKDCFINNTDVCQCARDELRYTLNALPKHTKCLERGEYEPCVTKSLKSESLNHTTPTETVMCDGAGDYQPVQCKEKTCYCVNKFGTHLGKYENPVCIMHRMTKCQCARDQDEAIRTGNNNKLFFCDRYGNY